MNRKPGDNTSPIFLTDEIQSAHGGPPLAPDATIRCPFCSEAILASAKKCKHCGEFLDKRNTINATVAAPPRVRRPRTIIAAALALLIIFVWVIKALIYPNGMTAPGMFDPGYEQHRNPIADSESVAATAHALDKDDFCLKLADQALMTAVLRDRGVSRERLIAALKGNQTLDTEIKLLALGQTKLIYDHPNISPLDAAKMVAKSCEAPAAIPDQAGYETFGDAFQINPEGAFKPIIATLVAGEPVFPSIRAFTTLAGCFSEVMRAQGAVTVHAKGAECLREKAILNITNSSRNQKVNVLMLYDLKLPEHVKELKLAKVRIAGKGDKYVQVASLDF